MKKQIKTDMHTVFIWTTMIWKSDFTEFLTYIIIQHISLCNVWSMWHKSNPFATHICCFASSTMQQHVWFSSLMCVRNITATCLISTWGKHASSSLPLGTNTRTHTNRLVMIFSYGEPRFTCTTSSCTRTNDVAHLVSTRGIRMTQHVRHSMCYTALEFLQQSQCVSALRLFARVLVNVYVSIWCALADIDYWTEQHGPSIYVCDGEKLPRWPWPCFHLHYCFCLLYMWAWMSTVCGMHLYLCDPEWMQCM